MTAPNIPDKGLTDKFKAAHNRFHGRLDTHGEVAVKAQWTLQELEGVQNVDEELYYDELEALFIATQQQLLTELMEKADTRYGAEIGTGETFYFKGVSVEVLEQKCQQLGGES